LNILFKLNRFIFSLLLLSAVTVNAQDSSNESADTVEDLVTTARRRAESVSDVPIAISAFSGADLDDQGIENMEAINEVVSNVLMVKANTNQNGVAVGIRGLGTSRGSVQWDQKISIYVDDVYMIRPQGSLFDLFDVKDLQVLKGPQGTLFGKNTTSGAILVNNNTPVMEEFQATFRTTIGQRNLNDVAAMVNLPITSNTALRIVSINKSQDGYIDNLDSIGMDGGMIDNESLRAMLSIDVTDNTNILLSHSTFNTDGTPVYPNCDVYTSGTTLAGSAALGGFSAGSKQRSYDACKETGHYESYHDGSMENGYLDLDKSSLKITSDLGFGQLTVIHAKAEHKDQETPWMFGFLKSGFDNMVQVGPRTSSTDGETSEVRFSSSAMDDRLQYTVGYFESDVDGYSNMKTIYGAGFKASSTLIPAGYGAVSGLPINIADIAALAVTQLGNVDETYATTNVSEAIFAEATYAISDQLNLTLGYRSSEDTKGIDINAKVPAGGMSANGTYLAVGLGGISPYLLPLAGYAAYMQPGMDAWAIDLATGSAKYQASKCDPVYGTFSNPMVGGDGYCRVKRTYKNDSMRAILDYSFDNGNMVYMSFSEGYMPGNSNDSLTASGVVALPEELTEVFEIGTKSSFLDGKLNVNAAYFNQDFLNKSIAVGATTSSGVPTINTVIQPVVEMSGYEMDLSYNLSDSITLSAFLGHVEGDDEGVLEYNVAGAGDTYGFTVKHDGSIAGLPTSTVFRSYTAGEDIMTSDTTNGAGTAGDIAAIPTYSGLLANGGNGHVTIPEYTLYNLNINMMVTDKVKVALYIENLTDEEHSVSAFNQASIGSIAFFNGPPRTAGISFTVDL
jgi:iron complex outermembrane receptor protein